MDSAHFLRRIKEMLDGDRLPFSSGLFVRGTRIDGDRIEIILTDSSERALIGTLTLADSQRNY